MKYLITGGAGFIGSQLADKLIADGDEVIVLDDLSAGETENLHQVIQDPNFEFVQGSVLDETLITDMVQNVDSVYHLASVVGVKSTLRQPELVDQITCNGTSNVAEACLRYHKKLLFTSSSEVYAGCENQQEQAGLKEDAIIQFPEQPDKRWQYAAAKWKTEIQLLAMHQSKGLNVRIARMFNVAGLRQRAGQGMVIPGFMEKALNGEPLKIHGDGTQKRCFTHVADAIKALQLLMGNEQAAGEIVNIGGQNEITINELAQVIVSKTGSQSEIMHISRKEVFGSEFKDVGRRVPDISKLHSITGFRPQSTLTKILDSLFRA